MPNAIGLSLLAGMALVMQNAVMVAMTGRGLSLTGALLCNSLVGLLILSAVELYRGESGLFQQWGRAELWFVVPGVLGTFFVFASLFGYRTQGSAATIVLIITGQIVAGLLLDRLGWAGIVRELSAQRLLGTALVIGGAVLVARAP